MAKMTLVTELKCGDVFTFREVDYVCLLNFIDDRTSQSMVTAILEKDGDSVISDVYGIRFFKYF